MSFKVNLFWFLMQICSFGANSYGLYDLVMHYDSCSMYRLFIHCFFCVINFVVSVDIVSKYLIDKSRNKKKQAHFKFLMAKRNLIDNDKK